MYKGIIVEDEFNAQQALTKMLRLLFPQLEIVKIVSSFETCKPYLGKQDIDLVFLDIELEDGTSVEKLKEVDVGSSQIIFTTGYSQYAIEAIKLNALDYLLKPIEPSELKGAVEKAFAKIDQEKETRKRIKAANRVLDEEAKELVVKTIDQIYYIQIKDIVMLQSEGAYTRISTKDTTILASKHLKYYEQLVSPYGFIRTHQSFVVNKRFVRKVQKSHIQLEEGMVASISVRKYSEVMALLAQSESVVS
ncbi:LytTR family DNA-binding domain-containing protein [Halosquirtibacter laminarini]|uniref:LytTR family DNA-binding domain-containing protein n=1 Tax=Halosquirtibacter laminarini TaxID=3374600 RepID=A0AC61NHQ8_9BACT|nr:LytTR family DNA-binding domain-containing protein [Prolixibacteraceae bacterium]